METNKAIAVQLPVWMAPNDYVLMTYIRDEMWIYFKIWTSAGTYSKQYGMFKFENVWSVKSARHKPTLYYPDEEEHNYRSYYLIVPNSSWINELYAERELSEKDWRNYDKREFNHYVIQSHDFYIEIVATGIEFEVVDKVGSVDFA